MLPAIIGIVGVVIGYTALKESKRANSIANNGIYEAKRGNFFGLIGIIVGIVSTVAMIYFFMPEKQKEYEVKNYYDDGTLRFMGNGILENKEGEWKWYSENGILVHQANYNDNILDGDYKEFYDNGNLKIQGEYDDGIKVLEDWKCYDKNGSLKKCKDIPTISKNNDKYSSLVSNIKQWFNENIMF